MEALRPSEKAKKQTFKDALGELLSEYAHVSVDELISAMEIQIMALQEQENG